MDGFDLDGTTWWKRDGSDHFTVRSVVFFGNEMEIQTTDGRILHGDAIQEYIQSEEPINMNQSTTHINKANLLQGMSKEELGDIFVQDTPAVGDNLSTPIRPQIPTESENNIILKRLMDTLGYPESIVSVELKMTDEYITKLYQSADIMGLKMIEIKSYMQKHFESHKEEWQKIFMDAFTQEFDKYFYKDLVDEVSSPIQESEEIPEKKTKKKKNPENK